MTFFPSSWSASVGAMVEARILVYGFGLSLTWEFLQSPLYADAFEASWDTLAYNRVHCALGDAMILLAGFWIVAIFWGRSWIYFAKWGPVISFVMAGVIYTGMSEYVNVYTFRNWSYSPWMPTVGGIGLAPLLQWVVIPPAVVGVMQRMKRGTEKNQKEVNKMRKVLLSILTAIIVLGFVVSTWAQPMMGQEPGDPQAQAGPGRWGTGPWSHMGPGMGAWEGMGPGMMRRGMGMMGPGMRERMSPGTGMPGSMGRGTRGHGGLGMGIWRGMLRGSPEIMGAMMSIRGEIMSLIGQQIQKYGNDFRRVAPEVQQKMRKEMIEALGQIFARQGAALSEKANDIGK